jgi:hypothetical protein
VVLVETCLRKGLGLKAHRVAAVLLLLSVSALALFLVGRAAGW